MPPPPPPCRYALTYKEVVQILKQRLVKVDGKVRTDTTYPAGFMDVIELEKTDEHFRLVYDTKGRFVVHRISKDEAAYKLCKVKRLEFGKGGVPYIVTHDARTIRYPDPEIKVGGVKGEGPLTVVGGRWCRAAAARALARMRAHGAWARPRHARRRHARWWTQRAPALP